MGHRTVFLFALVAIALPLFIYGQKSTKRDDGSLVIIFKDGRQKSYSMADVARVEFSTPQSVAAKDERLKSYSMSDIARIEFEAAQPLSAKGQNRFLGKWKVGDGAGSTFYITLESDGTASKSTGADHGHWVIVGNEARISWDDGWHDAIRKNGAKYEKVAYRPGTSFTDEPDNVTKAEHTEAEPL